MSYCRFGWDGSDAYVTSTDEGFTCYCRKQTGSYVCETPEEMITHLAEHRRDGEFVPEYAITGLWQDIPGADAAVRAEPKAMLDASVMIWPWKYT